ncbi:CocE/NonD family hydrolase [Sphingomonas cavernae]|uniref:Alpha/beta hydrolase n=1 Tax=Sphingomonas cavernae TaxID=2320861 RepID=A0A418WK12_9SPHN|nr:CocE/NonD family hydrolase [Sphingomonas cavernae]RJF90373.1 alpha/beta hydrolase [Sphingomonas cavernae]
MHFIGKASAALLMALSMSVPLGAREAVMTGDLARKDARPLENTAGLETEYGVVTMPDGVRLRSIVTRPEGARGPLPAVFFAQWVSCGSIEFRAERPNTLRDIAQRSGLALIRVERAGTGDSEGPACSALDYDTEVAHYRAALDQLSRHRWIDSDRIVIYGSSLGSTTAPLIAEGRRIAGIVVQGGGALTYLERMIQFDRINLERAGKMPPDRIHGEMLKRIAFQQHYLIGRKTPSRIAAENPELKGVWESLLGTEPGSHYGRPFAWHWQAADKDFLAAWTRIAAPVMVVYGEYDQYETRHGHRLIVDTVNALRPGGATWLEIPGGSHDLEIFPSAIAAYRDEGGRSAPERFTEPVIAWLKRVTAR